MIWEVRIENEDLVYVNGEQGERKELDGHSKNSSPLLRTLTLPVTVMSSLQP